MRHVRHSVSHVSVEQLGSMVFLLRAGRGVAVAQLACLS